MVDPKSRVQYIHVRDNMRRPILTVAYAEWYRNEGPEDNKKNFRVGWAARCLNDRYNKDKGRDIAEGRLMKDMRIAAAPVTGKAGPDKRMERACVLRSLLPEGHPDRAPLPDMVVKYLRLRIQALETTKPAVYIGTRKETLKVRVENGAVHVIAHTRDAGSYDGPRPLEWLTKQLKDGEWKITKVER